MYEHCLRTSSLRGDRVEVEVGARFAPSSPWHAHKFVNVERVDGLLTFVNGIHHILVDLPVNENVCSVRVGHAVVLLVALILLKEAVLTYLFVVLSLIG